MKAIYKKLISNMKIQIVRKVYIMLAPNKINLNWLICILVRADVRKRNRSKGKERHS
jgi:hypothetical protein